MKFFNANLIGFLISVSVQADEPKAGFEGMSAPKEGFKAGYEERVELKRPVARELVKEPSAGMALPTAMEQSAPAASAGSDSGNSGGSAVSAALGGDAATTGGSSASASSGAGTGSSRDSASAAPSADPEKSQGGQRNAGGMY